MLKSTEFLYKFNINKSLFHTLSKISAIAKDAGGKSVAKSKVVVEEAEPVRDTKMLASRCCGVNKYKDQDDPVLKPDSEYPDWLWSIDTGKPKRYDEYDPNTKEYWHRLREHNRYQRNLARKGIRFYQAPRDYELNFTSRLPLKVNHNEES